MIYPEFIKRGGTIGVPAPSSGIYSDDVEFDISLDRLRAEGYKIKETASVRSGKVESAPPAVRGEELNSLFRDGEVDSIICASGGDFLISMLPYVDLELIRKNPKWVQGYSDPTSLLYTITTKCDVATVYGANAGGFWQTKTDRSFDYSLDVIRGDIPIQKSFELYERDRSGRDGGYNLTEKVEWIAPNGDFKARGRIIGGCLDCLADLVGTRFDGTLDFIDKYRADGFIWYFDIFAMKAEMVHNTLFKMKDMGMFEHARGFIFGRVCFPSSFADVTYIEAAQKILGDAPMVFDADVGHVAPKFTLINGAIGELEVFDGKGQLKMILE